jgi:hypothetical protein
LIEFERSSPGGAMRLGTIIKSARRRNLGELLGVKRCEGVQH